MHVALKTCQTPWLERMESVPHLKNAFNRDKATKWYLNIRSTAARHHVDHNDACSRSHR